VEGHAALRGALEARLSHLQARLPKALAPHPAGSAPAGPVGRAPGMLERPPPAQEMHRLWRRRDVRGTLAAAAACPGAAPMRSPAPARARAPRCSAVRLGRRRAARADEGAVADMLEVVAARGDAFRLEHAAAAAALAARLLAGARAAAGLAMLAALEAWFGELLRGVRGPRLGAAAADHRVDPAEADRRRRCEAARAALLEAAPAALRLAAAPGERGARAARVAAWLRDLARE
jgi:hypothetical protein